ncbi:DUF2637 domain-containing protein [Streptomyces reticuliscabiei]|uniref:DUF2637 domain-containing protein n=1 Tax=Streptomyces reticuliscabiei TaxID=146821 RepID=UPI00073E30E2|nr:DUF2637 domain-containing protein [Streptomyces reticuliscabiei]GAQ73832.1 hypothetical protein T45_05596 [Streptomyces turgidiscabies]
MTSQTPTPETARPAERAAVPPLSKPEKGLLGTVAVLAAGVGGLGLASSFEAVSAAGARWGFDSPWMLPVGVDAAIPVFTAAFLLLIRTDMPLGWVRFVPWVLTGVTCWLNIAAGHSLSAKLAHGTMPLLWVVLSEVAAHVYASRIGAVTGRRMEKIRFSRWLLAPLSTFGLWRRMTLWEVTSYSVALGRERERQLARAQLREQHGVRWRSKTPRPERVLLKLGELAPQGEDIPPVPPVDDPEPPKQEAPKAPRKRAPQVAKGKTGKTGRAVRTPAELLAEARTATADWTDAAVNAEAIRTALHCSAANSRVLRDLLLAERADGPHLHPVNDDAEGVAA